MRDHAPAAFLPPAAVLDCYCALIPVPAQELRSQVQTHPITRLRHEAMWMVRNLSSATIAEIGRLFGGRHQSSVSEALDAVADRIAADEAYRLRMRHLRGEVVLWLGSAGGVPSANRIAAAIGVLADTSLSAQDRCTTALTLLRSASHG